MYAKNKRKIHPEFELFLKMNSADNSGDIKALQKALNRAIETELTLKQSEILNMYFYENLNMTQIAAIYNVNKSTISRHIKNATEKLRKTLRYAEFALKHRIK